MPFRISLPCGVILRTWRMVKMNGGGMAAWGSAARGEFPPSSKRASDVSGAMLSGSMGPTARPTPQTLAYAGLSLATVGWAAGFVAGKLALGAMSPLVVAAWRYAVAAAILLPFALRQRPDRRRLAGVLVALAGAATVITRGDPTHLAALSLGSGDLVALAAAATWAAFNLTSRHVVGHLTPAFTNCVIYALGAVALYVLGSGDRPWAQLAAATPSAVAGVVVMAVLSSVIAGQFFLIGVRTVGIGRTVVFVYLVPVLTALMSTTLLGEQFLPAEAVGGATVLAGVYWTTRAVG